MSAKGTPKSPVRVGVLGPTGRMGEWVVRLLEKEYADRARIAAAVGRGGDFESLLSCDVVIDFALPEAVLRFLALADGRGDPLPALVCGSTGWTPERKPALTAYARRAPVLAATNFSLGVQALRLVLRNHAQLLKSLGYVPSLVETHHEHKRDAPSGTAITLRDELSPAFGSAIQIHSVRAGEVVGEHEVGFFGPSDRITFSHVAQDRGLFARGALEAALWLVTLRPWSDPDRGVLDPQAMLEARFGAGAP
ncbi:MAG: hypothetical protein IT285_00980 [Bdellovibrionales bacterium]|nr:hypothetical protein [Bdellovibrionales bacterium]